MKNTYIELGINPSGTILVLAPVIKGRQFSPTSMMLSDLESKGMADSVNMIGQMLIVALGSFHPEIAGYHLRPPPPLTPPFPGNRSATLNRWGRTWHPPSSAQQCCASWPKCIPT